MSNKFVGILLAAGYGRRFGADKLLAALPDGTPIAVAAARSLRDGLTAAFGTEFQIVAALRPEQHELAALLSGEGLVTVSAIQAERGMGASLAAAVMQSRTARGWIVALGDMPYVLPTTICAVARTLQDGAAVAAPWVDGRRGHPVGFSNRYGDQLSALDGDEGARRVLARTMVTQIPCDDPGALRDIDIPNDMLR